jgi:hypothetical protein
VANQKPLLATVTINVNPGTLFALQCLLDAFSKGLEVRIVTQPDLVAAVDQLMLDRHNDSSLVGDAEAATSTSVDPTLEAAAVTGSSLSVPAASTSAVIPAAVQEQSDTHAVPSPAVPVVDPKNTAGTERGAA